MKAAFVDKDGTLVRDVPYNVDPARVEFTSHALEGLSVLDRAGYAIVVVTNQPGLATGRFTRRAFGELEAALRARIARESGVVLAGFYCCPHAPDAAGRPACLCRKPAPGMLRRAAIELSIELGKSWLIGDILDDVEAAHRAGSRAVLLDVGNETEWKLSPIRRPEHSAPDLLEAARRIVEGDAPHVVALPGPSGDNVAATL